MTVNSEYDSCFVAAGQCVNNKSITVTITNIPSITISLKCGSVVPATRSRAGGFNLIGRFFTMQILGQVA